jgi:hypothetical protein
MQLFIIIFLSLFTWFFNLISWESFNMEKSQKVSLTFQNKYQRKYYCYNFWHIIVNQIFIFFVTLLPKIPQPFCEYSGYLNMSNKISKIIKERMIMEQRSIKLVMVLMIMDSRSIFCHFKRHFHDVTKWISVFRNPYIPQGLTTLNFILVIKMFILLFRSSNIP